MISHHCNSWVYNILDGTSEAESVIVRNDDFVLVPDFKWDQHNLRDLHCLGSYCILLIDRLID